MPDIHPMIAMFEGRAIVREATGQPADLAQAIIILAIWLDAAKERLSEDDLATLTGVGATMFQEGLARRMRGNSQR